MAKSLFCILWLLIFTGVVSAQKHLDASKIVPMSGDTMYSSYYKEDLSPSFLEKNKDRMYNLNFIKAPFTIVEMYQSSKEGKYFKKFPESNLVLLKANGEEVYYKKMANELYCVGEVRKCNFTKSGVFLGSYNPAKKVITSNMDSGARYGNDVTFTILLAKSDLNGQYTYIPNGADSLQLNIQIKENTTIDDYGILILNGEKYNIQRHTTGIYFLLNSNIKSKSENKWTEKKINILSLPAEIQPLISTAKYYNTALFCEDYKGPIVTYTLKDDSITDFIFQNRNEDPKETINWSNSGEIIAYPNPTYGDVSFEFINVPSGDFRLEIYNIIGKKLMYKDFSTVNDNTFKIDLSNLRKGTYLYSIIDGKGKKIVTRRLSIISI